MYKRRASRFAAHVRQQGVNLSLGGLPSNGFNLSAAPGSRNGHATADAAQAERHGPAQPAAAASDQGNFSRVRHN
jgi:hypothetical protein